MLTKLLLDELLEPSASCLELNIPLLGMFWAYKKLGISLSSEREREIPMKKKTLIGMWGEES